EPRLRFGPGQRGEGQTVVVEAMEVRYGAALCEDQRISTRGGRRPVVLARSLIDGERGKAKACRRLRREFAPGRGCGEAKVGMAHLRDRERCVCSALAQLQRAGVAGRLMVEDRVEHAVCVVPWEEVRHPEAGGELVEHPPER